MAQGAGRVACDLPLREALVESPDELAVLLQDALGIFAGRAEYQLLQLVIQIPAGLLGHLPVNDSGLQVPDEGGTSGSRSGWASGS